MRGLQWFNALSAGAAPVAGLPASLKVADGVLGEHAVRFIAVVPDAANRFPRARQGEVGLLEGWGLAKAVDEAIASGDQRPIVAIVDVPSQAYGRREEALGIHQALAAAADSYARARLAGHPVIGLLVGKASAARVTLRSVEELEALAASVPPMAYDIDSYASLGLLWETLTVSQIEQPTVDDLARVRDCLVQAIKDVQNSGVRDLRGRLGAANRAASSHVRQLLREQW